MIKAEQILSIFFDELSLKWKDLKTLRNVWAHIEI